MFFKHVSKYLTSEFINKGISLIIVFLLIKWLTVEQYGEISLLLSYIPFITMLISLNMYRIVPIFLGDGGLESQLHGLYQAMIFIFFILLSFYIIFASFYSINIGIIAIIIGSFFMSVWSLYKEILIYNQESTKYSLVNNIGSILLLISSLVLTIIISEYNYDSNLGRIYGFLIQSLFLTIYVLYHVRITFGKIDYKLLKYFLTLSIPLIFYSLASVIMTYFDRIMINFITKDLGQVGIYSIAYSFGMIINVVTVTLTYGYRRLYFDVSNEKVKKIYFESILIKSIVIINILVLIFILITKPAFNYFVLILDIDPAYSLAMEIIPWVFIGYYFLYLQSVYVMDFYKREKTMFLSFITMIAAFFNILINFLLIPSLGYLGAAISTTISYLMLFVLTVIFNKNKEIFSRKINILISASVFLYMTLLIFFYFN